MLLAPTPRTRRRGRLRLAAARPLHAVRRHRRRRADIPATTAVRGTPYAGADLLRQFR